MGKISNSALYVIYAAAFMDLCAMSMMIIQFPLHLRNLGADHVTVGYIGSIYGFVQLFSSPVMGGYAELHSKKSVLLFSILVCSGGYLLLGFVHNLWLIALLRIYVGIFKHPLNLLQSLLSDFISQDDRDRSTQLLGYYQSAGSLAFIVAPPIGGYLMQWSHGYSIIGIIVTTIYFINTVLLYLYLPREMEMKRTATSESKKTRWSFPSLSDVDQVSLVVLLSLLLTTATGGILWRNSYPVFYRESLHFSPTEVGFLISLNAVTQTLVGAGMKYVAILIPDHAHQVTAASLLSTATLVTMSTITHHFFLYPLIPMLSIATMVAKVSINSFTRDTVGKQHMSTIIGINGSLTSAARLVCPIIAGYILQWFSAPTLLRIVACFQILMILQCNYIKRRKIKTA